MKTIRVYKIINNINSEVYIGSCLSPLKCRWSKHKLESNTCCSKEFIEKYGVVNCHIILIKEYKGVDCIIETRKIARAYEQLWMNKYSKDIVNERLAFDIFCKKCHHGIFRSKCKECGGGSICEHDRERSKCKDCGGSQICEHNKQRSQCKECGGSHICEHNRIRSRCKECGGSQICEHNRIRSQCKECGGGTICEHNKRRSSCKECNNFYCKICSKKYSTKQILKNHKCI